MMETKIGFIISGTNDTGTLLGYARILGLNEEAYGPMFNLEDLRGLFTCDPYVGSSLYTLRFTDTAMIYSLYYLLDGGRGGNCRQFALAIPYGMEPSGISVYGLLNQIRDIHLRNYTKMGKIMRADVREDPQLFESVLDMYPLRPIPVRKRMPASPQNKRYGVVSAAPEDIERYLATPLRKEYREFQEIYIVNRAYSFTRANGVRLDISAEEVNLYTLYYNGAVYREGVAEDELLNITLSRRGCKSYFFSGTLAALKGRPEAKVDEERETIELLPAFEPLETVCYVRFVEAGTGKSLEDIRPYLSDITLTNGREMLRLDTQGKVVIKGAPEDWNMNYDPNRYVGKTLGNYNFQIEVLPKQTKVPYVLRFDAESSKPKELSFVPKNAYKGLRPKTARGVREDFMVELESGIEDWTCEIRSDYYEPRNLTDLKACEGKTLSLKPALRRMVRFTFSGKGVKEALAEHAIRLLIDGKEVGVFQKTAFDYKPKEKKREFTYQCELAGYRTEVDSFIWSREENSEIPVTFVPRWTNGLLRKAFPLAVCLIIGIAAGFFGRPFVSPAGTVSTKDTTEVSDPGKDPGQELLITEMDSLRDKVIRPLEDSIRDLNGQIEELKGEVAKLKGNASGSKGSRTNVASPELTPEEALVKFEKELPKLDTGDKLDTWVKDNQNAFNKLSDENRKLINGIIWKHPDMGNKEHYTKKMKNTMFERYAKYHKKGHVKSIGDLQKVIDNTEKL